MRGLSPIPPGRAVRTRAGALALAAALAAFVPGASAAQARHDLFIVNLASDSLDATYFIPPTAPPAAGYPGILFVHGFGGSKDNDTANGRIYAASGYITLAYSVRGHGRSTGASTIMSAAEREDLAGVVAFMRTLPGIDTNSIGVSGGSQGGLHGLWAIADGLPVAAVSSDVIVPRWASDMLVNGSVRRTLVNLLKSPLVSYGPVRDTLWEYVRNDDYDALLGAFVPARDVDTAALNPATVPSLRFLKWQDHYFSAADGIAAFRNYAGSKKLYLGTQGHFSDPSAAERLYANDQVTRWLAHFLKGADNGITGEPLWTFAESSLPMDSAGSFLWTRTGTGEWPPAGVQPWRFYLAGGGLLSAGAPAPGTDSFLVANDHVDPGYTFDIGYIEGFRGPSFEHALPRTSVPFESDPLPWDVEWVGAPRMVLQVSSPSERFPLHAQVYEVDSGGAKHFVNRINYTARGWPGGEGTVTATGLEHAHRFAAGSRIRIELTNIDVTNRVILGSFPFVLPTFADAAATVISGPGRESFVEFPLLQPPTGAGAADAGLPAAPSLLQNYPNPFNAATTIVAVLPGAGRAVITVYDMLGREAARVADADLPPGRHAFRWDASAHPSGVYFARLSVTMHPGASAAAAASLERGTVTAVRKLVLAR